MLESIFIGLVLLCLGIPIASFVILLLLGFFDKELDYLQLENKKIEMEKELHRVEYFQLSQQIEPHFLFNSLNAMLSLGRLGRAKDQNYALEQFSKFLRYKYSEKDSLVPFKRELSYTKHYIFIQKIRFDNRLSVELTIDERAQSTYLPPYMLQTLVENAFKHGLEKKKGTKNLFISLEREGNWVTLIVMDNGPDFEENQIDYHGIGLQNIKKRLGLIYELYTDLKIYRKNGMTIAKVIWPYTPEGKV
ncbi:histidine kinase [Caldibacillus sp. 210928-DFI.2.22]|uniref:sensor histidine kinase n=1 Tax=unclassified Caldibacillus TaxID=2641266 RepID=UPI001D065DA7|nr:MULTISPECIES: histidine kinase [unclassified Caldibacillus]MCB7071544.1 histidine kinase [Caldibacillus sp. 210928-DFI.2.22]MCB7074977.1 histidine kinase [Caldibacillus sp. 210928-DFI.2.18]